MLLKLFHSNSFLKCDEENFPSILKEKSKDLRKARQLQNVKMPPKKNVEKKNEEVEEIKKSLDFMSEEIITTSAQQKMIMDLMGEIKELKRQNVEKDKKISLWECQVADLEQSLRMNN